MGAQLRYAAIRAKDTAKPAILMKLRCGKICPVFKGASIGKRTPSKTKPFQMEPFSAVGACLSGVRARNPGQMGDGYFPSFALVKARAVIWKRAVLANPESVRLACSSVGYKDLWVFVAYHLEHCRPRAEELIKFQWENFNNPLKF
jgi:hypothetical protein